MNSYAYSNLFYLFFSIYKISLKINPTGLNPGDGTSTGLNLYISHHSFETWVVYRVVFSSLKCQCTVYDAKGLYQLKLCIVNRHISLDGNKLILKSCLFFEK